MKIAEALIELGYKEFVVTGNTYEGIEWIVEPETIPTKEEVEDMATKIDEILETRKAEQKAQQQKRNEELNSLVSGNSKPIVEDTEIIVNQE